MSTDLNLRYSPPSDPVVAPTDILHVHAGQSAVMVKCLACGWKSQPFMFTARKVHLTARSHFLGVHRGDRIVSWRCKQSH